MKYPRIAVLFLVVAVPAFAAEAEQKPAPVGPLKPAEALATLQVPDDLQVDLVLSEPEIAQPVFMNFDERGRLWVVEYRQYPNPAGLTEVSRDKFWRTVYDKVPPPPPHHFVGKDRITIHEDSDGDGVLDRHKTFLDGLNIVTSVERGRGGVWVLNPPYLLFYPDRDNDDVPDGDPEVHLEGFGLEDTHSCANSLQWGPDGWLYAAQGSTVSGNIRRPGLDKLPVRSMGQLIWRYHPETRRYEIFAEGGGNAFGVEIDSKGRVYSGHNGGDTRGFHYVQGGYYQKGFSKHGPLSNPYSFGYFPFMQHQSVPRFTHNFVIYEGAALPAAYRGKLFGVAPLLFHVVEADIQPDGSTFKTVDVGHPITTPDVWFRPVDIKVGPDGAIYVADFYEAQIAHLRHHEGTIDPTTGRIYRLRAKGAAPLAPFDLSRQTSDELVTQLQHENKWFRRAALRLLGDRHDAALVPALTQLLERSSGQSALEALWAINLSGGFNEALALKTLGHSDPYVRAWTARLLGDAKEVSPPLAAALAELAATEPNVEVRSQLACTARRLPAGQTLPIVRNLLARDEDAADPHLPLLLWWAVEAKAETDREAVLALFGDAALWQKPIAQNHLLGRLMKRYAMAGTRKDLQTCARLLALAADAENTKRLMQGFEEAFQGRSLANLPPELADAMEKSGAASPVLKLRQGNSEAVEAALAVMGDDKAEKTQRMQFVQVFGQIHEPHCLPALLKLATSSTDEDLRMAALTALQPYGDPSVAEAVLEAYAGFSEDVRAAAQTLLTSRKPWALAFLAAIDAGKIEPKSVPLDVVRKLTVYRDDGVTQLVAKHWGSVQGATTAEMQEQIAKLQAVIGGGTGSPYNGKKLFNTTCAKCHTLFGQGGQIGPDLTPFKRDDVSNLLVNIVNPSAEIREGFTSYLAVTTDGRSVTGFLVDRDSQVVVLRGADGQNISLASDEIEEMASQPKSIMPEGQLQQLSDEQVRDLFAYLRTSQPLND